VVAAFGEKFVAFVEGGFEGLGVLDGVAEDGAPRAWKARVEASMTMRP
jgi:hypothetical protein